MDPALSASSASALSPDPRADVKKPAEQQQDEDIEVDESCISDDDDDDDDDDLDYYYYSFNDYDDGVGVAGSEGVAGGGPLNNNADPDFVPFDCLTPEQVDKFLMESVEVVAKQFKLSLPEAKLQLHKHRWSLSSLEQHSSSITTGSPSTETPPTSIEKPPPHVLTGPSGEVFCDVCATWQTKDKFAYLKCGHWFCKNCWEMHFVHQIGQGVSTGVSCMSINCDTLASEDFVLSHVHHKHVIDKYKLSAFQDYVLCHPFLRFCPGGNCKIIVRTPRLNAKRCVCTSCKLQFCFQCGGNHHAPTDCETIKRWLTKCADDSETANYISAHTKDCPKCHICIEKNGGCNHMQCYSCKHDFCWMCLGDWKAHGSEYYECSRYKENPNIAHESAHAQAREALKKYLHYFERWENHSKSMKLEAQTLEKIRNRITQKVMEGSGTWIDWQYLLDASTLLAKCRYTLQYTYPYAYYMAPSPRKELFEYQQAQLEAEIENLSWKIEHAESTDRGDLENQIDIAEKRRTSLLKDFLPS